MLQIYLTDLQAYNEGHLVGCWISLPTSSSNLAYALSEILSEGEHICHTENHEEYFITDYEWDDTCFFEIGEYDNLGDLNTKCELLDELQTYQRKAVAFLLSEGIVANLEEAIAKADDVHVYENQTLEDVAYDLIHECYNIHELSPLIANHIDYAGIARDLEYDGCYFERDGDVFEYTG